MRSFEDGRLSIPRTACCACLVLVAFAACATPYKAQTARDRYGYREVEIKPDVYFIEFKGNASTDLTAAGRYWHRRGTELCAERGKVAEPVYLDPLATHREQLSPGPMGGFLFLTGEPLGAANEGHSRAGFIICRPPTPSDR